MQSVISCIPASPCRDNSSSPCVFEEWRQQEQKMHLGVKRYHGVSCWAWKCLTAKWETHSLALYCPVILLTACHMWGQKLEGFSAQVWQSPTPQLSSGYGSWRAPLIPAVAVLAPLGLLHREGEHKVPVPSSCSSTWDPGTHFLNQSSSLALKEHLTHPNLKPSPLQILWAWVPHCVLLPHSTGAKGIQTSICLSVFFIEKESQIYLCIVPTPSDINFHLSSSIEKWLVSFSQPQLGSIIIHWLSGLFITRFKLKLHFRSLTFFFFNIKELKKISLTNLVICFSAHERPITLH